MATPVSPEPLKKPPGQVPGGPGGAAPPSGYSGESLKKIDPSGVWTRFFQQLNPSQPVSAQDVKMFQEGLLRWFNLIINQENKSWKRTMDEMKKSMNE